MKSLTIHLKHTLGSYARAAVLGAAVLTTAFLAPTAAQARVFLSVYVAPPVIPVYEQPLCPGDGYIWTPGYWAYGDQGYFWVDGAWVEAPYEGALWTPGYWGYNDGAYLWNAGYWGTEVGYYGGINYGFGYFGSGFYGGRWNGGHFFYNSAYNHIDFGRFHNVYEDRSHGSFVHPGGRAFDPHPQVADNRGSHFGAAQGFDRSNRDGFNQGNRSGFDQNRNGFNQDNRGGINQARPENNGARPDYNQGNRMSYNGGDNQQHNFAPQTQATQPYNRPAYNPAYSPNQGRGFANPQQGYNQPQQQPRSFSQPAQPQPQRSYTAPQQTSRPAPSAPAPQHWSAPANTGSSHGDGRR